MTDDPGTPRFLRDAPTGPAEPRTVRPAAPSPAAAPRPPAAPQAPAARSPERVAEAPERPCSRCDATQPTKPVFVLVRHSRNEHTEHGFLQTTTITTHQFDHYTLWLCASCKDESDALHGRLRRVRAARIAGIVTGALALPAFFLGLMTPAIVLLGLGAAVYGLGKPVQWWVDGELISYLPLEHKPRRSIAIYTTDLKAFIRYLGRKTRSLAEVAEMYRRRF